jgi:hypothetical protein
VRRAALAAVLAAAAVAVPAAPAAAACSGHAATDVQKRLAAADAAFVGRRVERSGSVLVFRVGVHVKGRLGRRVRVHWTGTCTAPPGGGRRKGILLHRKHGRWFAGPRDVVAPGELLKTAGIGP